MKKLIMAAAIAMVAIVSQAAGYSWKSATSGGILYDGTTSTKVTPGTVLYMFMDVTQESVFKDLAKGTDIKTLGAATSAAVSSASKITTTAITGSSFEGTHNFFFAAVFKQGDKDVFYISSVQQNKEYLATGSTALSYGDLTSTSKSTLDMSAGFKGAGVYGAVPEPSSALLLLLGMAGMALRRRRA